MSSQMSRAKAVFLFGYQQALLKCSLSSDPGEVPPEQGGVLEGQDEDLDASFLLCIDCVLPCFLVGLTFLYLHPSEPQQ